MYENYDSFKFHDIILTWILGFVFTFGSSNVFIEKIKTMILNS